MKDTNKKLFIFNIDNQIDIITNSSSELFLFKSDNKEVLISLIESIYPDFRSEYMEPMQYKDMDLYRFESCIEYQFSSWRMEKKDCIVFEGFKFEEIYEKDKYQREWEKNTLYSFREGFLQNNKDRIIKSIDPNNHLWFLYSIEDNPNYEMQELLEQVAVRYHLG